MSLGYQDRPLEDKLSSPYYCFKISVKAKSKFNEKISIILGCKLNRIQTLKSQHSFFIDITFLGVKQAFHHYHPFLYFYSENKIITEFLYFITLDQILLLFVNIVFGVNKSKSIKSRENQNKPLFTFILTVSHFFFILVKFIISIYCFYL